jgi:tetratricopeptide (TPR) repeat protein
MKKIAFISLMSLLLLSCKTSREATTAVIQPRTVLSEELQREFYSHFYEGNRLREEGKPEEALQSLMKSHAIDSLDAGLLYEKALCQLALKKSNEALVLLRKAVELEPANWWFSTQLISVYTATKDFNNAIIHAEKLLGKFPDKEASYNMLIGLYRETEQPDKAIALYEQLEKITGVNERISFEKLRLYLMSNKLKKAIAEIDRLILKYPLESKHKLIKGDILMETGQQQKAYELYMSVLETDPESPFVYTSLMEYFNKTGDKEKAMEYTIMALKNGQLDLETKMEILGQHIESLIKTEQKIENMEALFRLLIDRYPLEEAVHGYYAAYLQYIKRDEDAAAVYESMLAINPANSQTWFSLMQVYYSRKEYEKVLEITDRAIAAVDDKISFYFFKSISLQLLERNEETIALIREAVVMFENHENKSLRSDLYANLGDVYQKLEKSDSAFVAYEESLKLNPENIQTLNNYAYFLSLEKKDLGKAEKMSAKTIEKEPRNSTYLDTYAWIFYQQGLYTLAKFYIERAMDNLPKDQDSGVILEHYGDILWKSGDKTKAMEMWKKAYDSGHQNEDLKKKIENNGPETTENEQLL